MERMIGEDDYVLENLTELRILDNEVLMKWVIYQKY